MAIFSTYVVIQGVKTLVDGGISLTLHTRELDSNAKAKLFDLQKQEVCVAFKTSQIVRDDLKAIPEPPLEFKSDKTPSQRLRAVLFVRYSQNKPTPTFEEYYIRCMNEFIEGVKEDLEPREGDNFGDREV